MGNYENNNVGLKSIRRQLDSYNGSSDFPEKSNLKFISPDEQNLNTGLWKINSGMSTGYKTVNSLNNWLERSNTCPLCMNIIV